MSNSRHSLVLPGSLGRQASTTLCAVLVLAAAGALTGCQRGEKSCKYYSLVLERSDSAEDKRRALEEIKRMNSKDQLKCDDDKVFDRITKAMDQPKFRPIVVEMLENLGRAGGKLRDRCEKLLIAGLKKNDAAGQIAGVIRTWRLETAETGRDAGWLPSKETAKALAEAIKRIQTGGARGPLVEALFLSVPGVEDRKEYEDLLIELADTDPSTQTVDVNIKALQYLAEMRTQKETAFDAYVHGLFLHDAARAETFMAARLALATFPREKVADKLLGIYLKKDADFEKWTKVVGLFDWEWKEGPKVIQVLSDVHVPKTASAILAEMAKPVDVTEEATPPTFKAINKALPWAGYIISRLQLSMWALAGMGKDLDPIAEEIAKVAKTQGLGVEQRTFPFIALAVSGAPSAWTVMSRTFTEIAEAERGDFLTPMIYAVDTQNYDDWVRIIDGDPSEGVKTGRADPTIVGRLKVVQECKKAEDAAADEAAKKTALLGCYVGFLKAGDEMAQEKAAINLVHLAARGEAAAVMPLLEGYLKSPPTSATIRQILHSAFKHIAKPEHLRDLYQVQQLQVAHGSPAQTWIWEFDVLLSHVFTAAGGKLPMPVNIPANGAAPAPPPAAGAAPAGAPPAGAAPAGAAPAGAAPAGAAPAGAAPAGAAPARAAPAAAPGAAPAAP